MTRFVELQVPEKPWSHTSGCQTCMPTRAADVVVLLAEPPNLGGLFTASREPTTLQSPAAIPGAPLLLLILSNRLSNSRSFEKNLYSHWDEFWSLGLGGFVSSQA